MMIFQIDALSRVNFTVRYVFQMNGKGMISL